MKNSNCIIRAKRITYLMSKRVFDIIFSLILILILSPFMLLVTLAIVSNSLGGATYHGKRTGLNERAFYIYKFRTMIKDAEKLGGASTALNDPRLTGIGRWLRKYKIDELLQLFNILFGTMSFVGPRPQVEKYTKLYTDEEKLILSVKPGLTDYASIYFSDMDSILGTVDIDKKYLTEIEPVKNKLRLKYVLERSFFVDLKLIFFTLMVLIGMRKIWNIDSYQKTK